MCLILLAPYLMFITSPTMSNLCTALDSFGYKLVAWNLNVTITVNDKWEGETEINF
jgi:hypothetical protein